MAVVDAINLPNMSERPSEEFEKLTFATSTMSPAPKAETGVAMKRSTTAIPSQIEVFAGIVAVERACLLFLFSKSKVKCD